MPSIDPTALDTTLTRLGSLDLEASVQDRLQDVVDSVASLFQADGAGLMFVDDANAVRYVAASDEAGRVLEEAQERTGHGPCVDAIVEDVLVTTADVATDERWPGLAELVAPAGVHAVIGLPVHIGAIAIGSLNVYRAARHEWDESEIEALRAFNGVIEALVGTAVLARRHEGVVAQLQHALDSRVVVERAIGFLMGVEGWGATDAFDRLRLAARSSRRTVADVAHEVLDRRQAPAPG